MSGESNNGRSISCGEVFERLVSSAGEAEEPRQDPALAAHLGSCMSCFRVLTEMRDAPRIATLLRDEGPAPAMPAADDPFWAELAARTTTAAAAARSGEERPIPLRREKRRPGRLAAFALGAAMAAAAAWVAVVHGPLDRRGAVGSAGGGGEVAGVADEIEDAEDVDDLDVDALRRLLDRLEAAPSLEVTALVEGDSDLFFDDDDQLGDELADLDRPELLRIESSFEGAL